MIDLGKVLANHTSFIKDLYPEYKLSKKNNPIKNGEQKVYASSCLNMTEEYHVQGLLINEWVTNLMTRRFVLIVLYSSTR